MTTVIEARFASLEASSRILSGDVKALTTTLRVVNKLQSQQREIARRNEETQRQVEAVKVLAQTRADRAQQVLRRLTLALAILLPLASLLVYYVLLSQVNGLLNQYEAERFKACEARNEGIRSNQTRELALAAAETNPALKKIHEDSARAQVESIIDCRQLYGAQ